MLLCYWEGIDRRKRKAWSCWWGRSLGSDGCWPCEAPSSTGNQSEAWLVNLWLGSALYVPHPQTTIERIFTIGEELWRGLGWDTPLPCMHANTHTHTNTHWKDHFKLFKLESGSICPNNKDWSDDVDVHPPHPITLGGMTSRCPSCICKADIWKCTWGYAASYHLAYGHFLLGVKMFFTVRFVRFLVILTLC